MVHRDIVRQREAHKYRQVASIVVLPQFTSAPFRPLSDTKPNQVAKV